MVSEANLSRVPSAAPQDSHKPAASLRPCIRSFWRSLQTRAKSIFPPLILVLWLLTGCKPAPLPLRTLTIAIESAPTQIDPRFATDAYSERLGQLLFSRLVRLDGAGRAVPDLAERWENPAPTVYLFHLRRGVRWHDGTELTAEDVRATFASILDPKTGSPHRKTYEKIARIEIPDRYTVRFVLREPHAPLLVNLSRGIIPRAAARAGRESGQPPIGSGPFRLARYQPDERLELEAFPDYYGGRPSLDRLIVRIIPEDTIRLLSLQKGEVDAIQNAVPPDAVALFDRRPQFRVIRAPGTVYSYLGFNLEDPILRDRKVRQAIAHALDRAAIIRALYRGQARPAVGILAPENWFYEAAVRQYPYDPAGAARLLNEAGRPDPDGPGPAVRFRLVYKTSQNEMGRRIAEVIQAQLGAVGIEVKVRSYEWGTFYGDIKSGNFQLYSLNWVGVTDPDIYFEVFHSGNVPPNGANRGRYRNPELDRLVEAGRRTIDPDRRRRIYDRVQEIVAEDLPYVSLWYPDNVAVVNRRVRGWEVSPAGDFYPLAKVWVEEGT